MGITLHYRGRLSAKEKPRVVYHLAKVFCDARKWPISDLVEQEDVLEFRRTPGMKEYRGPVSTFVVQPHENCEPFRLAFTREGRFEDHCKTQFAPLEVHQGLVGLLEDLKGRMAEMVVEDEGHYWESRDADRLEANIIRCFEEILKAKEEDPSYYGPVKEDDGRITDLVRG
jgi:hypothetical protein